MPNPRTLQLPQPSTPLLAERSERSPQTCPHSDVTAPRHACRGRASRPLIPRQPPPTARPTTAAADSARIRHAVAAAVSEALGIPEDQLPPGEPLMSAGLTSVAAVALGERLASELSVEVPRSVAPPVPLLVLAVLSVRVVFAYLFAFYGTSSPMFPIYLANKTPS